MSILAGIVLFNPELNRLKENIDSIITQVENVVLVDNGSSNFNEVLDFFGKKKRIQIIGNESNKGIATALRQIMEFGITNQYDWVLTLDQDSVCKQGLIEAYSKYFHLKQVGILTCNIVDRNFRQETGFTDGSSLREVRQCITSASLINIDAYCQTDGFDEKLFIDSVDFDICINMRHHGYKIIKVNFDGLIHEVGHGKNVNLLGKKYITYNHSSFRQYYMARNHMYLVKKYPNEFSKSKEIIREIRSEILIMLYEKNKFEKIRSRWKGLLDSRSMS